MSEKIFYPNIFNNDNYNFTNYIVYNNDWNSSLFLFK